MRGRRLKIFEKTYKTKKLGIKFEKKIGATLAILRQFLAIKPTLPLGNTFCSN